jgi:hypothetical protein
MHQAQVVCGLPLWVPRLTFGVAPKACVMHCKHGHTVCAEQVAANLLTPPTPHTPTTANRVNNACSLTVLCELRPSLSASACHMARSLLDRQDGRLRMALGHSTARHGTTQETNSQTVHSNRQHAPHACTPFCVFAACCLLSVICCRLSAAGSLLSAICRTSCLPWGIPHCSPCMTP